MKKHTTLSGLLFLAILITTSCKKNNGTDNPPDPQGTIGDVYVAGTQVNSAGKGVARYWKNGTAVVLTDGSRNAIAHDIVVAADKVYVAGFQDKTGSVLNIPTIWVNGEAQALGTTGGPFDAAMAIAVSGDDVYAAGFERGTTNSNNIAKYWKNGTPVALTDGKKDAEARDVFVLGNDVYVCGWEEVTAFDNRNIAKYWKNGVAVTLPLPTGYEDASAMSIFVSGNDVYVSGTAEEIISGNEYTRAVYWKNNVMHTLPTGSEFAVGISIFPSGADVYVAGRNDNTAISLSLIHI